MAKHLHLSQLPPATLYQPAKKTHAEEPGVKLGALQPKPQPAERASLCPWPWGRRAPASGRVISLRGPGLLPCCLRRQASAFAGRPEPRGCNRCRTSVAAAAAAGCSARAAACTAASGCACGARWQGPGLPGPTGTPTAAARRPAGPGQAQRRTQLAARASQRAQACLDLLQRRIGSRCPLGGEVQPPEGVGQSLVGRGAAQLAVLPCGGHHRPGGCQQLALCALSLRRVLRPASKLAPDLQHAHPIVQQAAEPRADVPPAGGHPRSRHLQGAVRSPAAGRVAPAGQGAAGWAAGAGRQAGAPAGGQAQREQVRSGPPGAD